MTIQTERLNRILEVIAGKTLSPDDSSEEAAVRRRLVKEVVEIRENGGIIEIPPEIA